MREVNLISLIDGYKNLSGELFESYLKYHSIKLKESELVDLSKLINEIKKLNKEVNLFDKYFIGYSIPQIGKEFDLLRIDQKTILNIEIKQKSTIEKIQKQLERNKYYLSFLKRDIHCFTYISEENKFYTIDDFNDIVESNIRQLISAIKSQEVKKN